MDSKRVMRSLSTPITLIILLGLLAGGVFWGYKAVTAKVPGPPLPVCETVAMTVLEPTSVTVNVYNAGTRRGMAGRVAKHLGEAGFIIDHVGNTEAKVLTVLIIGAAIDNPEVQLVAGWFAEAQIEEDGRTDHSVEVIVGSSFDEKKGWVAEPVPSLEIPSGQVCLPPSATPTPTKNPTTEGPDPSDEPT